MSDVNYGISNVSTVMTSCASAQPQHVQYHRRLEKVKFGVPLDMVCKKDIPGPLLMMLLKLNKEGPFKRDVFRAPGHQGNMRKLIHFLQQGRLVNIQNYSVNTIASVLKKFLRKIPGGIFGPDNEANLFRMVNIEDQDERRDAVYRIVSHLPIYSQHLLVLLFGTFRVIASNSAVARTGMTAEALGVSVAPSFFHTCVTSGKTARMEDVERFKHATRVTSYFIENFGMQDLFGRTNYEYYARLTGRILKVEDEWIFFTYPLEVLGVKDDSDIALNHRMTDSCQEKTGSLEMIPENCGLDPRGRLSISLDDHQGVTSSPSSCGSSSRLSPPGRSQTLGRPKQKSLQEPKTGMLDTQSYACLPQVHQRQTERMRARSDWFLSDSSGLVTVRVRPEKLTSPRPTSLGQPCFVFSPDRLRPRPPSSLVGSSSYQVEAQVLGKPPDGQHTQGGAVALRRRLSDKDKERRLVRRSSSKRKDKENGGTDKADGQTGPALKRTSSGESSHPCLSRAASQDSNKGIHSRGGSFDQESSSSPSAAGPEPAAVLPSRTLPRI